MPEEKIPVVVLYCYADEDEKLCKEIDKCIRLLRRKYQLDIKNSHDMSPGVKREQERAKYLNSADIILLMISNDYIQDEYYEKEIVPAVERLKTETDRVVRVISILLRYCDHESEPFNDLPILPTSGTPISDCPDRDKTFTDIAKYIRAVIDDLFTSPAFLAKKRKQRFEECLKKGKNYFNTDNPPYEGANALDNFEEALQVDPKNLQIGEIYFYKAITLLKRIRYNEVQNELTAEQLKEAMSFEVDYVLAYYHKYSSSSNRTVYQQVLELLDSSFTFGDNIPIFHNTRGITLNALGRYEEAMDAYEKAISCDKKYALAYYNKGNTHFNLKQYEEALMAYKAAIDAKADNPFVYRKQGDVLHFLRRFEEASNAYKKARQMGIDTPSATAVNYDRGDELVQEGQYREALEAYEEAILLDPSNPLFYCAQGRTLFELKHYNSSLTAYETAIKLNPDYALAHRYKGDTLGLLAKKLEEQAKEAYARAKLLDAEAAILEDPDDAQAYYTKANALEDLKRDEEAKEAQKYAYQLERLIKIVENMANNVYGTTAYYLKGQNLFELKRYDDALAAYDEMIRCDPDYPLTYEGKGDVFDALGRTQEAQEAYAQAKLLKAKQILLTDKDNPLVYQMMGEALRDLGRMQEAEVAYQRARELGLDDEEMTSTA